MFLKSDFFEDFDLEQGEQEGKDRISVLIYLLQFLCCSNASFQKQDIAGSNFEMLVRWSLEV